MKYTLAGLALILNTVLCSAQTDGNSLWRDSSAPIPERVESLLSEMTVQEKISILVATSVPIERFGMAKYYHGNEALHGVVRPGRFTVFPQAIGLASMWDPDMLGRVSTAISDEARARWNELGEGALQTNQFSDLLTFWSPTINMARDPRWGRTPETYGEDPYLSGLMGTAFVRGLQGDDPRYLKVVSTPKHFACNNEEHNRMECNAVISEKQLREYYLPAYEMCVKDGHAQSIMASYNAINGVPSCCNPWLLTDVLRGDWGFDGYVVSDCGGVENILHDHKYAASPEEAAMFSLKSGLDLECGDAFFMEPLQNAYDKGMVTDEDIDRAARRVLTARMRLGLFDSGDENPYTRLSPDVVGCQKHQDLALEAARKSIVLLKNQGGLLPLDAGAVKSVAVLGNNAAQCELGDYSGAPTVEPVSVLKAVTDMSAGRFRVNYVPWKSAADETDFVEGRYFRGGVKVEYFDGQDFSRLRCSRNEDFLWYDPAGKAPDPQVPDYDMSARWTGRLCPDITGEYVFKMTLRGNARMWIDGKVLYDNDGDREVKLSLEAGREYDLKIEYRQDREFNPQMILKWSRPQSSGGLFADACDAAASSDVVIAVMGINRNYEREGRDRDFLELPQEQIDFLKAVYAVNRNVVLVVVAGSSMAVNWENEHLPAIIDAWYGGEFGGTAIAEVLFGKYNPGGRLPLTFYKGTEQLPAFDDYDISKGRTYQYFTGEPLYPFGYGLSYTDFKYSGLKVTECEGGYNVKFRVTNAGKMDGDEVAQVYVRMKDYEGKSPVRQLKGFRRISLRSGERQDVTVFIPREQLRWWSDAERCFKYTSLRPSVYVGSSSADIRLKAE